MVTSSASFRVMGKDLDPSEVTRLLKLEPDQSHKRGDHNVGRSGQMFSNFSEGLWAIDSLAGETASVDDHLQNLIGRFMESKDNLHELKRHGHRLDIFIGIFGTDGNTGFGISSKSLRNLVELGVELEFDIYSA